VNPTVENADSFIQKVRDRANKRIEFNERIVVGGTSFYIRSNIPQVLSEYSRFSQFVAGLPNPSVKSSIFQRQVTITISYSPNAGLLSQLKPSSDSYPEVKVSKLFLGRIFNGRYFVKISDEKCLLVIPR